VAQTSHNASVSPTRDGADHARCPSHQPKAYGEQNIRANSVSPGAVMSETALKTMSDEFKDQMRAGLTLTRLGEPSDLAQTICFLLSDDTTWVSGQVWSVNGGAGFRD